MWHYYQNIVCPTRLKDNCEANYNGASGGMGVADMKNNFHRFLLWYVNFLCADLKALVLSICKVYGLLCLSV
jgi:hypothetical protein